MSEELELTGGWSTSSVVRVGNTVRRPSRENAAFVRDLLRHLIEVGFDSAVLVFLACYTDPASALVIWSAGETLSQITRTKRPDIRIFNVGLGYLSGFVAVSHTVTPR